MNNKIAKGLALLLFGILLCAGSGEINATILYNLGDFPFAAIGVIVGVVGLYMVFDKAEYAARAACMPPLQCFAGRLRLCCGPGMPGLYSASKLKREPADSRQTPFSCFICLEFLRFLLCKEGTKPP